MMCWFPEIHCSKIESWALHCSFVNEENQMIKCRLWCLGWDSCKYVDLYQRVVRETRSLNGVLVSGHVNPFVGLARAYGHTMSHRKSLKKARSRNLAEMQCLDVSSGVFCVRDQKINSASHFLDCLTIELIQKCCCKPTENETMCILNVAGRRGLLTSICNNVECLLETMDCVPRFFLWKIERHCDWKSSVGNSHLTP